MKRRLATLRALVRPPFAVLLGLCAAVGMAQAGSFPGTLHQLLAFGAVSGWMLWAVALNDLADEEIDRVNLAADFRRVLVTRRVTRRQLAMFAVASAVGGLACAVAVSASAALVVGCGLALAAAYSLPPLRLSGRGALTAAVLPLGYVAVPFLVGAFSVSTRVDGRGLLLLAGLYLGFMGRLVLKDFRDVRGDRLYGKRTLFVRHGRRRTCAFSATFWTAGALVALVGAPRDPALVAATLAYVVGTLVLLADVARDDEGTGDVASISTIAVIGRALLYTVLLELVMTNAGWHALPRAAIIALGAVASLGMARDHHEQLRSVRDPLTAEELAAMPPPAAALAVAEVAA